MANKPAKTATLPIFRGTGLQKTFGREVALQPMDIMIQSGAVFGLLGANGGGKSTLLKIIAGLERSDAGSLQYWGQSERPTKLRLSNKIGYMAQSFALYPTLTVQENIRFRAELHDLPDVEAETQGAIERYGLTEVSETRACNLSGGWSRMAQFAASLIHAPPLILLDEPTAGLDADARRTVWRHIERLSGAGATVVIATHDMIDAEMCDTILCMSDGRVLGSGSPEEVASSAHAVKLELCENIRANLNIMKRHNIAFSEDFTRKPNTVIVGREALDILNKEDILLSSSGISLEEASVVLKLRAQRHKPNLLGDF